MPRVLPLLVFCCTLLLASGPASADEPAAVAFSLGLFDTAAWLDDKGDFEALEGGVQLRGRTDWFWGLGPIVGVAATDEEAFWIYAGTRRPFALGEHWLATPSFAVSYYEEGDGKDLGHELEFRSGIELSYRFDGGSTLGLEYYHLSNASISDTNPGSNSLVVVWSRALSR